MKSKFNGIWLLLIGIGLALNGLLIIYRIELADRLDADPVATSRINFDMARTEEFAFFTDEINYYNFVPSRSIYDEVTSRVSMFFSQGVLVNINSYGYYVKFVRDLTNSWKGLLFLAGVLSYILFSIELMKILSHATSNNLMVFLSIILSPIVLQLSAGWMRDLFVMWGILLSIKSAYEKRLILWCLSILVLLLLRAYTIPIALVGSLLFFGSVGGSTKKRVLMAVAFLSTFLSVFLLLFSEQIGLALLTEKILPRLIQNFTGLTYGFIRGYDIPSLKGNLADTEVLGYYFIIISYAVFYLSLFRRRKTLQANVDAKRWLIFTVFTGIYIVVLHSASIGFFVNRIIMITWVPAMITLAKLYDPATSIKSLLSTNGQTSLVNSGSLPTYE